MLSTLDFLFFFFNDTATTEIYTLSLHDALPISDMTGGDMAIIVTTGALRLRLDQTRVRTAFVQVGIDDLDHAATTGRGRLDFNERHYLASSEKLISWPGFKLTNARLV